MSQDDVEYEPILEPEEYNNDEIYIATTDECPEERLELLGEAEQEDSRYCYCFLVSVCPLQLESRRLLCFNVAALRLMVS